MRMLVCGGRDYYNILHIRRVLDEIHTQTPVDELVTGGANGVDTLAYGWALRREITAIVVPAKWTLGKKGGILRNIEMLEKWNPDLVVAFPGGKGTAHMKRIAIEAGKEVKEIPYEKG